MFGESCLRQTAFESIDSIDIQLIVPVDFLEVRNIVVLQLKWCVCVNITSVFWSKYTYTYIHVMYCEYECKQELSITDNLGCNGESLGLKERTDYRTDKLFVVSLPGRRKADV